MINRGASTAGEPQAACGERCRLRFVKSQSEPNVGIGGCEPP